MGNILLETLSPVTSAGPCKWEGNLNKKDVEEKSPAKSLSFLAASHMRVITITQIVSSCPIGRVW